MKTNRSNIEEHKSLRKNWRLLLVLIQGFTLCLIMAFGYLLAGNSLDGFFEKKVISLQATPTFQPASTTEERIENGIHLATGMVYDERFPIVRATCTACHSAKLVTQNRATREGWQQMIQWMQATQGLWELGKNEAIILDYLAEHYAPKAIGRRAALDAVEWYNLELEE